MANTGNLTNLVTKYIGKAQNEEVFCENIYSDDSLSYKRNNFLFFIKPEITLKSDTIKLDDVLDLIFDRITVFGFNIHNIRVLSANYLDKFNLIEQHYGVIAQMASSARKFMTEEAKQRFSDIFEVPVDEALVLGGKEFLERYTFFDYHSLDCLWQNSENFKLASGTYAEKLHIDLETVYLINGFNPKQLRHFTEKGRCIITMNISGDLSWSDARNDFVGATNPVKANSGSLRRILLDKKDIFGIPEVSQSYNGVHLSAGPVEALIELHRFDSDFSKPDGVKNFIEFPFGLELAEAFNEIPESVIDNSTIMQNGKRITIFDLTENLDSGEAISLLKKSKI
jgi:hypothetical protein